MITLAAAAAVTNRIRLVTTVLLAPTRNAGILAKEAATLDVISGGRLTLGVGIGGREDDFIAAPAPFKNRGQRLEEQLEMMKRIWAGQPVSDGVRPVGPPPVQPGGPEILMGGYVPAALERTARWANGFISGGVPPDIAAQGYSIVEQAWQAAGRPGKPRFVSGVYWAIGDKARAGAYIRDYYGYMGAMADAMAQALPSTAAEVKELIKAYEAVGVDEVILWPCIPDIDQVDRLAEAVG
jgi:alkanesulfonate monooxygenase SsuD/methylene tetrahydromethanopterin reductase-like flavin-dependent oxidoreductase (luciferase family)